MNNNDDDEKNIQELLIYIKSWYDECFSAFDISVQSEDTEGFIETDHEDLTISKEILSKFMLNKNK